MDFSLKFNRLADIDCLTTEFKPEQPTVVLIHGYGANFQDLAGLAPLLDPGHQWNWVFPNGIIDVPIGPHIYGKAWFPIDMEALQREVMTGQIRSFADHIPSGFDHARKQIAKLVLELDQDLSKIVLGGFSQGAMIACHAALNFESSPKALLQLSSTLVAKVQLLESLQKQQNLRVFQSHGLYDPILPVSAARELYELLKEAHATVEYVEFPGGHEIPMPVINKLQNFLASIRES